MAARAQGTGGEPLRVAAVKFGSVNWLLDTIRANEIDTRVGLRIAPVELSNNQAGPISLLSGGSDVIVSDWTWALRQRGMGEQLKFAPYSSSLGAVMVAQASPVKTLTDLEGKRIGVAGSSIDKSWLLLQAYARKTLNFDLATKATIQFGAAPLITEQLRDGGLDAALNFWTQTTRLEGFGFRPMLAMRDVMAALAIDPVPAFVGFIWKDTTEAAKGPQIAALLKAVEAGNAILASSDAAWDRLKPLMKASNDIEFAAMRSAYRAGIVGPWREADMRSAEKIMGLLVEAGDAEFVGAKTKFDPKLFHVANA
jgi:NitT/TauT family transport system substrate-binding protein